MTQGGWRREVMMKGSGDEGKWWRREVMMKGSGDEGKWWGTGVVTKGSGEEGKWWRREVVKKGSGEEGKWWRRGVVTKGSGEEGEWWRREVDEGKWWRREVVTMGRKWWWRGVVTEVVSWGGSRSTKPCVFPCKVAAGDNERYLVCAAGAAGVVSCANWFLLCVLQRVVVSVCVVLCVSWISGCGSHWNGCVKVAWAILWGGSRSTKPCVFSV